jgi:hypothetical protein
MPIQRELLRKTLAERSLDRSDLLELSDRANACVRAITHHHPCTTTLKPIDNVVKFAIRAGRCRFAFGCHAKTTVLHWALPGTSSMCMHSEFDFAMHVGRHCLAYNFPTHIVYSAYIVSFDLLCMIHIYILRRYTVLHDTATWRCKIIAIWIAHMAL